MAEGIRKRKKGATYSYRINYKDREGKWKTEEKSGFKTIREAQMARAEKVIELNRKKGCESEQELDITLDEVYNLLMNKEVKVDRAKSTVKRYDSVYRNHLKGNFGKRKIRSIKAVEVKDYLFSISEGLSIAYVESIHKFIKLTWRFAMEREFVNENIALNMKLPKEGVGEGDIKVYTKEELRMFGERFESTNLITAFYLGRDLGVRIGECFGLLWSDIDWKERKIKVRKQLVYEDDMWTLKEPKTKASIREIDLQNGIYNYLKRLKVEQEKNKAKLGVAYRQTRVAVNLDRNKKREIVEDLDFINIKPNGDLLTPDSAKILGRTARRDLGINFKFHNLRHTHASMLAEKGIPMVVVKKRLGHSKEETTMKYYTHITKGMQEQLMDSLNKLS